MLALLESKQLRETGGNGKYAAQLFNYAKFQIDYVLGDSGRRSAAARFAIYCCMSTCVRGRCWN